KVRHAALGLFCCGICFYLTALAIHVLLVLGLPAGIPGACILCSGILILLITASHTLLRASRLSRSAHPGASRSLYENDSAQQGENVAEPRIQRKFSSLPAFPESESHQESAGSPRGLPRMHRTLWVESGLLQAQGKAWNVITQEMGNVMARKASGKDSTLV
ncbi:TM221 protein, partial [Scytalopus superciliaris]|nr:TM221 protein [Scytalopus superciliaris]